MPRDDHLTGPELIRLAAAGPRGDAAPEAEAIDREVWAHFTSCALCQARLERLLQQQTAFGRAMTELTGEPSSKQDDPEDEARVEALTERMMAKLRVDLGWAGTAEPEALRSGAALGPHESEPAHLGGTHLTGPDDAPMASDEEPGASDVISLSRARRRRYGWWMGGIGITALAATVATLILARSTANPRQSRASAGDGPVAAAPSQAHPAGGASLSTPAAGPAGTQPGGRRPPRSPVPEPEREPGVAEEPQLASATHIDRPDSASAAAAQVAPSASVEMRGGKLPARSEQDPVLFVAAQQIQQLLSDVVAAAGAGDTARVRLLAPGLRMPPGSPSGRFAVELTLDLGSLKHLPGGDVRGVVRSTAAGAGMQMSEYTFRRTQRGWVMLAPQR